MNSGNLPLRALPNISNDDIKNLLNDNINKNYFKELDIKPNVIIEMYKNCSDNINEDKIFNQFIKFSTFKKNDFNSNEIFRFIEEQSHVGNLYLKKKNINDIDTIIIWTELLNDDLDYTNICIVNYFERNITNDTIKCNKTYSEHILCKNWYENGICSNFNNCIYEHPDDLSYERNKNRYNEFKNICYEKKQNDSYFKFLFKLGVSQKYQNYKKEECTSTQVCTTSTTKLNFLEAVKKPAKPPVISLSMMNKKKEICGNWYMKGECHKNCSYEYHPDVMALKNNEVEFKKFVEETGNKNYDQFLIRNNKPRELCANGKKCKRKNCNYIHM